MTTCTTCKRCGGRVGHEREHPTCITCGWVFYGTPADIADRASHRRQNGMSAEVATGAPSTHARTPPIHSWVYPFHWTQPSRAGVLRVQFTVHRTGHNSTVANAVDIEGVPTRYGKKRMIVELRAAFKAEHGMQIFDLEACLDADGRASWATR